MSRNEITLLSVPEHRLGQILRLHCCLYHYSMLRERRQSKPNQIHPQQSHAPLIHPMSLGIRNSHWIYLYRQMKTQLQHFLAQQKRGTKIQHQTHQQLLNFSLQHSTKFQATMPCLPVIGYISVSVHLPPATCCNPSMLYLAVFLPFQAFVLDSYYTSASVVFSPFKHVLGMTYTPQHSAKFSCFPLFTQKINLAL